MVKVKLQPSARLNRNVLDSSYTNTEEDMPPELEVTIPGYPNAGDYIESDDDSGRTWQVIRTYWKINEDFPIVEVE